MRRFRTEPGELRCFAEVAVSYILLTCANFANSSKFTNLSLTAEKGCGEREPEDLLDTVLFFPTFNILIPARQPELLFWSRYI